MVYKTMNIAAYCLLKFDICGEKVDELLYLRKLKIL
jgi:hypothetical protein